MQLRRLRLRNIRSHPATDVPFGPGTTLITGDVGSGKTSLLYGVELALFGFAEVEAPFLVRHESRDAEVRLELGDDATSITIERRLKRVVRGGRTAFEIDEARLAAGGRPTAYSATELRQRVIELLGFPDNPSPRARSDVWRWAVYVPQERMREVLDLKPADRLETVRKALGLEQYRTAAENARELVAPRLRQEAETLEAQAEELRHHEEERNELSSAIERLTSQIRELERREGEARATLELAKAQAEATARRAADRQADEARAEELAASLREQSDRLGQLEREARERARRVEGARARLATLADAETEAESVRREMERVTSEREEVTARLKSLDRVAEEEAALRERQAADTAEQRTLEAHRSAAAAEVRRFEERVAQASSAKPAKEPPVPTRRTVVEIDAAIAEAEGAAQRWSKEVGRRGAALAELDELLARGTCPRCHQTVAPGQFGLHRTAAQAELMASEGELARAGAERAGLGDERAARERYDRALDRWNERERTRAEALAEASRARAEHERISALLGAVEARAAATGVRLAELGPRTEERARDAVALVEIDRRWKPLLLRLQQSDTSARERTEILEGLRAEERSAVEIQERTGVESERVRESGARLKGLRERLAATSGVPAEHHAATEAVDRALAVEREVQHGRVALDQQLRDHRSRLEAADRGVRRREELGAIAAHRRSLGRWLAGPYSEALERIERRRLVTSQHLFEGALARYFGALVEDPGMAARCGTSFAPAVEIEGEWTPPEALSGGERTALGLAFRLALGDVVRAAGRLKLETLILDEPTDGFSPEQVLRMGELLESLPIPQVILVSHEGGLSAFADRVVRVRKEEGISRVDSTMGTPAAGSGPATAERPEPLEGARRPRPRRRTRPLDATPAEPPPAV